MSKQKRVTRSAANYGAAPLIQASLASSQYGGRVPPRLQELLANQRLYGDGPPKWKNAPSAAKAERDRFAAHKRLERFRSKIQGASALADILGSCRPGARCLDGACPVCLRATQRLMVDMAGHLLRADSTPAFAITALAPDGRRSVDRLADMPLDAFKANCRQTFDRCECLRWGLFGVDISLNDDSAKGDGVAWQLQLHGIGVPAGTCLSKHSLSASLRSAIGETDCVSRPIKVKDCDGSAYGLSYALKTTFGRRTAYRYHAHGGWSWNTRKLPLKAWQHVNLLLFLHGHGLAARFVFHHVKLVRTNGRLLLRPDAATQGASASQRSAP